MQIKKLMRSKVVSFDIYDTLVKRLIEEPADIFELVSLNYYKQTFIQISDFRSKRIEAENECRQNSDKEVLLKDIYNKMKELTDEQRIQLTSIEEKLEMQLSVPIKKNVDLYNDLIKKGYRVILISDMYLSKTIVEQVLSNCGIQGYERLYVSSEIGLQKATGKLFDYVRSDLKIDFYEWTHVGDNIKSDYLLPMSKGIHSIITSGKKKNGHIKTQNRTINIYDEVFYNLTQNELSGSDAKKFGYSHLGILLYGFVSWLDSEFRREGIKKVFFFSREGYFIKEAFDLLYGKEYISRYLYVSRKSLVLPNLVIDSLLDELVLFRPMENKKAIEWLIGTGVDEKNAKKLLEQVCIDEKNEAKMLMPYLNQIKSLVNECNQKRFPLLLDYLDQEGVNGKFAVVDIGWTGSMQIALEKTLEKAGVEYDLYGYFIGQRPEMDKFNYHCIRNKGYLFSFNEDSKEQRSAISGNALFEVMFMAPHGTTLGYQHTKTIVEAVLDQSEYEKSYWIIRDIQQGAIQFLEEVINRSLTNIKISKEVAYHAIDYFFRNPSDKEINIFGDISFLDGSVHYMAINLHTYSIARIAHGFKEAFWKVGFLKRNLKIPLPYYKFYWMIRKYVYKH